VKSQLNSNSLFRFNRSKPPFVTGVFYLCLLLTLEACSSITIPLRRQRDSELGNDYRAINQQDFEDHLASLKLPFLQTPGIKVQKLDSKANSYVSNLASEIILNNEIFFKKLKSASITIIDTDAPLHFSLPKGEVFMSRGLLSKYIKHESMLASVLAFELARSEKLLYPKQTLVPTGFVLLERMLNLNRLSLEEKMEVHKWAHHLTVRTGFDGEYYLSWLQTQNRNTADFMLLVGDANQITREESLFKAFLIKTETEEKLVPRKESSKNFYSFINKVRDV
jgi:hypothetical protein